MNSRRYAEVRISARNSIFGVEVKYANSRRFAEVRISARNSIFGVEVK